MNLIYIDLKQKTEHFVDIHYNNHYHHYYYNYHYTNPSYPRLGRLV